MGIDYTEYKPLKTSINSMPSNPSAGTWVDVSVFKQPHPNQVRRDNLMKLGGNTPDPIIERLNTSTAEKIVRTSDTQNLQRLIADTQASRYTRAAAVTELERRGITPRLPNSGTTSPTQRTSPSTPSFPTTQSVANDMVQASGKYSPLRGGVAAAAPIVLGKVLETATNPLADALGNNVLKPLLLPSINKIDEALGLRPNPQAAELLAAAQKKLDNAIKQREGRLADLGKIANYAPPIVQPAPFTGGQSLGVNYLVAYQVFGAVGTPQEYQADGAQFVNGDWNFYVSSTGKILGLEVEVVPSNPNGRNIYLLRSSGRLGLSGNIAAPVVARIVNIKRADGQPDTGGDLPTEIIDPSPDKSDPRKLPEKEEWLYGDINIKVAGSVQDIGDANWKKQTAPFSPLPQADDRTVEPAPNAPRGSSDDNRAKLKVKTGSGFPQVATQFAEPPKPLPFLTSLTKPSFTAKPFVAGVSNPSERFNPVDIKTGLTRKQQEEQWVAANQAIQDRAKEGEKAAAANDALKIKEQLANLSDIPNPANGGISPRQQATQAYLNSIKGDAIKEAAFREANVPTKPQNTTPTTPISTGTPTTTDNNVGQTLGAIALLTGLVTALKIGSDAFVNASLPKINNIEQNTTPTAQQTNAKQGVCDAMQPQQCGYEGVKQATTEATNPIKDQTVANAGLLANILAAIANLASTIANLFGNVVGKLDGIREFLERVWSNQAVDKVMQYITMITVIHNAAMLSRSLADTLGSVFDQGLQIFGLQLKDKEGNQIGVAQLLGTSFTNFVKGLIGEANYTALTNTWIQANRIYQTGINLISNVQNILDSTTAVAELTNNRVATLMNALRSAGAVRENAYPAQSENVNKFNAFMNKLENLEQGTSNLASITGNIVSVQQSVNELKTNRTEFENALKDKPIGTGLPENDPEKQAAAQKKEQSIYTIGDFSVVRPPETP